jgi:quinol-cytochrome oxidoreductase complex cytochrome b subunit
MGRNLFYGSYRSPRGLLWSIGVVIFILMMASYGPSWYEIMVIFLFAISSHK